MQAMRLHSCGLCLSGYELAPDSGERIELNPATGVVRRVVLL
jgi:hypothetical protein